MLNQLGAGGLGKVLLIFPCADRRCVRAIEARLQSGRSTSSTRAVSTAMSRLTGENRARQCRTRKGLHRQCRGRRQYSFARIAPDAVHHAPGGGRSRIFRQTRRHGKFAHRRGVKSAAGGKNTRRATARAPELDGGFVHSRQRQYLIDRPVENGIPAMVVAGSRAARRAVRQTPLRLGIQDFQPVQRIARDRQHHVAGRHEGSVERDDGKRRVVRRTFQVRGSISMVDEVQRTASGAVSRT